MKFTSAIAATASGSIGGATASRNRGGQYFRRRAIPVNPNTVFQQTVRGVFGSLQARWSQILTAGQRDAWDAYALNTPVTDALGNPVNAGGKGMYTRGNTARVQAGLSIVDAGPSTYGLPSLTLPTGLSADASDQDFDFAFTNTDEWATAAGGALLVYISRPVSDATNYFNGPFRFAGEVLGSGTPPTSPGNVDLPFTYVAGQRGFAKFEAVTADGRLSSRFVLPFLCVA